MDKSTLPPPVPPIANAADYVDSLTRPQAQDNRPVKWKFIEGRRMRDKFLDQVIVPDDSVEQPPG
jgi:hypothetical protein